MEEHDHISTAEILRDIADTEAEIRSMEREVAWMEQAPPGVPDYRLQHMRVNARRNGIQKRREFVDKLRGIIASR